MHPAPYVTNPPFHASHEVACQGRELLGSSGIFARRHVCGGVRGDQSLEEHDQVMGHLTREP